MSSDCLGIRTVCRVGSANSLIGNGHRDVAKSRRNCDLVTAWISFFRGAATTKKKSALAFIARLGHAVNPHHLLPRSKEAGRNSLFIRISLAQIFSGCVLLTLQVSEIQTPGILLTCRDYGRLFASESKFYFAHCRAFETLHCEKSFSSIAQGGRKLSQCFVNQFRFCTE
jgi:hypothetical protein